MSFDFEVIHGLPPQHQAIIAEALRHMAEHNGEMTITVRKLKTGAGFALLVDVETDAAAPAQQE